MGNRGYPDTSSTSWELELGAARACQDTGTSQWDLPGAGTWASIALAPDNRTRSRWHCLEPCPGTGNWTNWSTMHHHQLGHLDTGELGGIGTQPMEGAGKSHERLQDLGAKGTSP